MSEATTQDRILTERRGHILVVTINRPEARGAFDRASAEAMAAAMDLLDSEPDLFVGVITGSHGHFSAGADLKAVARGESARSSRGGFGMFVRPPKKPVIAAVEGYAVGGGFELCLACDLVVAAKTAQFGLPEVRRNLVAVGGALFRLQKRIPYNIAMELALTGAFKPAEYFHDLGLVNRLTEEGGALEGALALAAELAANGPTALATTKEIMFQASDWDEADAWKLQLEVASIATNSQDRQEGLKAFAEKRAPVWTGR